MDYKLAKQLKDAGFPNQSKCGVCKHNLYGAPVDRESCDCKADDTAPIPTLSELIEACEGKFLALWKRPGYWEACYEEEPLEEVYFQGKTPEEAVARLWLEIQVLNKK